MARAAGAPVQAVLIEAESPYLSRGWPLFRRPVLPHQLSDVLPDQAVIVAVEIVVTDDVGNIFPGAVVEEHAADDRLLRLD